MQLRASDDDGGLIQICKPLVVQMCSTAAVAQREKSEPLTDCSLHAVRGRMALKWSIGAIGGECGDAMLLLNCSFVHLYTYTLSLDNACVGGSQSILPHAQLPIIKFNCQWSELPVVSLLYFIERNGLSAIESRTRRRVSDLAVLKHKPNRWPTDGAVWSRKGNWSVVRW